VGRCCGVWGGGYPFQTITGVLTCVLVCRLGGVGVEGARG